MNSEDLEETKYKYIALALSKFGLYFSVCNIDDTTHDIVIVDEMQTQPRAYIITSGTRVPFTNMMKHMLNLTPDMIISLFVNTPCDIFDGFHKKKVAIINGYKYLCDNAHSCSGTDLEHILEKIDGMFLASN